MHWLEITQKSQLDDIKKLSGQRPQVIFKHSTRCSISLMVKSRLERDLPFPEADFYYLDLLQHRTISDEIAGVFSVQHESPQILTVKHGKCTFYQSHSAINMNEIIASFDD